MLSHGHFLYHSITWIAGFVPSNLILDELAGWPGDRTGCASLSVNGCAMSVRHSQAMFSCQTAGMSCISCHQKFASPISEGPVKT